MINPYQHESTCCECQTGQDSSLPLLQSHQSCAVDDRWCNAPPVFASRPWERQHPWPQSACDGTNQRIFSHVNTAIYSINNNFHRPEGIDVVLLWSLGCFFVLEDVEWRGSKLSQGSQGTPALLCLQTPGLLLLLQALEATQNPLPLVACGKNGTRCSKCRKASQTVTKQGRKLV